MLASRRAPRVWGTGLAGGCVSKDLSPPLVRPPSRLEAITHSIVCAIGSWGQIWPSSPFLGVGGGGYYRVGRQACKLGKVGGQDEGWGPQSLTPWAPTPVSRPPLAPFTKPTHLQTSQNRPPPPQPSPNRQPPEHLPNSGYPTKPPQTANLVKPPKP